MKTRDFGDRFQRGPTGCFGGGEEVVPEFVDQFDAERDVAKHFAVEAVDLREAVFGVGIFPEFSAVVKKHTG